MTDLEQAGVGGFGDLGSHVMDLLLWFMQEDSPVACTGYIDKVLERYPDCDEYGESMIRFESGAVATLAAGWVDHVNPNEIEISGTEGHIRVTNGELFVTIPDDDQDASDPYEDLPEDKDHPLELFFQEVAGSPTDFLISADEAAKTNHLITRIYEADRMRRWVRV